MNDAGTEADSAYAHIFFYIMLCYDLRRKIILVFTAIDEWKSNCRRNSTRSRI